MFHISPMGCLTFLASAATDGWILGWHGLLLLLAASDALPTAIRERVWQRCDRAETLKTTMQVIKASPNATEVSRAQAIIVWNGM